MYDEGILNNDLIAKSPIKNPAPMRESLDEGTSFDQDSKDAMAQDTSPTVPNDDSRSPDATMSPRESKCPICHSFMIQPLLLACGHHICKSCD